MLFPMSTRGAQYRSLTYDEVTLSWPYMFFYDYAVDGGCQNHRPIVENYVSTYGSDTHDPRHSLRKTYMAKVE